MAKNKLDRRVVKTKSSIRKAFCQLIKQKEFSSITITEIAGLADIDRKTFYLHYSTVEDILREMENELAEKVSWLLEKNERINISTFFKGLNDILTEDMELYRRFAEATSYSFFLKRCKNILKASIIRSLYPKSNLPLASFQVYAEYISSGIISIYTDWLSSNRPMTLDELTEIAEDAVYHGWEKIMG
ncbi:TetR/AcrR family transcriptional regulator [Gorillibacterium timonense]|uniref:TetR/AcrR family transcriptional regulator n=1 Tax=Gorillibacterium timonense TaxID=1689269 RepID=UPI00071E4943|nr:TetR/AcrR family transcriptional regulator [Gorillibacterium timonense]